MKRLVLIGAGHAHAEVLHELAKRKTLGVEIVLICPISLAPYSGMVPGWLAGHYRWEECCIDFAHLCQRAGAKLLTGSVSHVDTIHSEVVLENGYRIAYAWLSINIGSTLYPTSKNQSNILPMRPLSALRERWDMLLRTVQELPKDASYRVLMIGGGAAGVESILAAQYHLTRLAPQVRFQFMLATHSETILTGLAGGASRRLKSILDKHEIMLVKHFAASHADNDSVVSIKGETIEADVVMWATGAQAYKWPARSGIKTDKHGFICIDPMLRSISHSNIFACGDAASWEPPLPKAGVFAVRMGPVLAKNLYAAISGQALHRFIPQRRYLVLIGSGKKHAVGAWGHFAWQGKWVWKWKEHIDRRFLARYNT